MQSPLVKYSVRSEIEINFFSNYISSFPLDRNRINENIDIFIGDFIVTGQVQNGSEVYDCMADYIMQLYPLIQYLISRTQCLYSTSASNSNEKRRNQGIGKSGKWRDSFDSIPIVRAYVTGVPNTWAPATLPWIHTDTPSNNAQHTSNELIFSLCNTRDCTYVKNSICSMAHLQTCRQFDPVGHLKPTVCFFWNIPYTFFPI